MTPDLKQWLRQAQRERLKHGNSEHFRSVRSKFRRLKRTKIKTNTENVVNELKVSAPGKWHKIIKKMGGVDQMATGRLEVESLKGLSDQECAEAVAEVFAATSLEYEPIDNTKLPAFLPAGKPEVVNVFQVYNVIKNMKKTKSTLPIDIPDSLRKECALDLAEPLTDIINTCLRDGRFPTPWRQEWVTPVPKTQHQPKNCKQIRKIASTSDYSKMFEIFLRKWIIEDIDKNIHINQFAGRKGMGTEHMIVAMVDRVLQLLDRPGMSAVVATAIDWMGAFDRLDPTITISKLVTMGVRSSLVPIIIEFMTDRRMSVRYNTASSKWHTLVGGSPQGSWMGQMAYISASDDAARGLEDQDKFKFCDDLTILELVMLGGLLSDYNFTNHVASDIGTDQQFLDPANMKTQTSITDLEQWTTNNKMCLNQSKTNYIIFNRTKQPFATRLTVNGEWMERQNCIKLLGVWLDEDGGWKTNTQKMCQKAYSRVSMLTKLRYAAVSTDDLITVYKLYIRSCLEYCSVSFHGSLSSQQAAALDRCQAVCLRVILGEMYVSYEAALEMAGLSKLVDRRQERCIDFAKKCTKHPSNQRFFPLNQTNTTQIRNREKYIVNFANTNCYKNSAIPYCQRLLNTMHDKERAEGEEEPAEERSPG